MPFHQTDFVSKESVALMYQLRIERGHLLFGSAKGLQLWVIQRLLIQVMCHLGHCSCGKHTLSLELTFFFPFQLQVQNGPIGPQGEGEPSGIPIAMVLVPVFALTMVASWAFMRYRQRLWKTCFLPVLPKKKIHFSFSLTLSCQSPITFPLHSQLMISRDCYPTRILLFEISESSFSHGRVKAVSEGNPKEGLA